MREEEDVEKGKKPPASLGKPSKVTVDDGFEVDGDGWEAGGGRKKNDEPEVEAGVELASPLQLIRHLRLISEASMRKIMTAYSAGSTELRPSVRQSAHSKAIIEQNVTIFNIPVQPEHRPEYFMKGSRSVTAWNTPVMAFSLLEANAEAGLYDEANRGRLAEDFAIMCLNACAYNPVDNFVNRGARSLFTAAQPALKAWGLGKCSVCDHDDDVVLCAFCCGPVCMDCAAEGKETGRAHPLMEGDGEILSLCSERCIERFDSISFHLNRTLAQEPPAPDTSRERAARAVTTAVAEGGDELRKAKRSGNAVVVGKKEGLAYNTREQVVIICPEKNLFARAAIHWPAILLHPRTPAQKSECTRKKDCILAMYLCPVFENLQVSQAWTESQAGIQSKPQLQLKWSLHNKWEPIRKNNDGSQYTAAYHEETTALFNKALKWAWNTYDGIEMIEEEQQVPSQVAVGSAQAGGTAKASVPQGDSAQKHDEVQKHDDVPGGMSEDQQDVLVVDWGTQDSGEPVGAKRARQDVEDGEGGGGVTKAARCEAGKRESSIGTDKVLESALPREGDPIVIEEDIGQPKDMDGVVPTTIERRRYVESQQVAHMARRRVGIIAPNSMGLIGSKGIRDRPIVPVDRRHHLCLACTKKGHQEWECPRLFYVETGMCMPGFDGYGNRVVACWVKNEKDGDDPNWKNGDGANGEENATAEGSNLSLSEFGNSQWRLMFAAGYFCGASVLKNPPPMPTGGWGLWKLGVGSIGVAPKWKPSAGHRVRLTGIPLLEYTPAWIALKNDSAAWESFMADAYALKTVPRNIMNPKDATPLRKWWVEIQDQPCEEGAPGMPPPECVRDLDLVGSFFNAYRVLKESETTEELLDAVANAISIPRKMAEDISKIVLDPAHVSWWKAQVQKREGSDHRRLQEQRRTIADTNTQFLNTTWSRQQIMVQQQRQMNGNAEQELHNSHELDEIELQLQLRAEAIRRLPKPAGFEIPCLPSKGSHVQSCNQQKSAQIRANAIGEDSLQRGSIGDRRFPLPQQQHGFATNHQVLNQRHTGSFVGPGQWKSQKVAHPPAMHPPNQVMVPAMPHQAPAGNPQHQVHPVYQQPQQQYQYQYPQQYQYQHPHQYLYQYPQQYQHHHQRQPTLATQGVIHRNLPQAQPQSRSLSGSYNHADPKDGRQPRDNLAPVVYTGAPGFATPKHDVQVRTRDVVQAEGLPACSKGSLQDIANKQILFQESHNVSSATERSRLTGTQSELEVEEVLSPRGGQADSDVQFDYNGVEHGHDGFYVISKGGGKLGPLSTARVAAFYFDTIILCSVSQTGNLQTEEEVERVKAQLNFPDQMKTVMDCIFGFNFMIPYLRKISESGKDSTLRANDEVGESSGGGLGARETARA